MCYLIVNKLLPFNMIFLFWGVIFFSLVIFMFLRYNKTLGDNRGPLNFLCLIHFSLSNYVNFSIHNIKVESRAPLSSFNLVFDCIRKRWALPVYATKGSGDLKHILAPKKKLLENVLDDREVIEAPESRIVWNIFRKYELM